MGINTKDRITIKFLFIDLIENINYAHWNFSCRLHSRDLSKSFHNGGAEMLSPVERIHFE